MDWMIGVDGTADNFADSDDIIITLEETVAGSLVSSATVTVTAAYELSHAQISYGGSATQTDTTDSIYPTQARDDVKTPEDSSEGVISTPAADAVSINRVGWL